MINIIYIIKTFKIIKIIYILNIINIFNKIFMLIINSNIEFILNIDSWVKFVNYVKFIYEQRSVSNNL